jgi:hypothetical protein
VRAGYPRWCGGFPPPLRLSDRSEGDVGEGKGSQRTQSSLSPSPSPPFVYAQRDGGPQPSVGWRPRSGREMKRAETWSHAVGRPLGSIQQENLQPVLDKLLKMIAGCSGRLLAYSRRLVLIKSCLASTPVYLLSFFKFPKWAIKLIES